jgi:O-antigen/teichoic acid export membrane protein
MVAEDGTRGPMLRWRPGRLGRGTLYTTAALVFRAAVQAAYLVVLSRWLGAEGYGLFAGSVAVVILFAPLSNWGMAFVFAEYLPVSPGGSRPLWRSVVRHAASSGIATMIMAMLAAYLLVRVRLSLGDMLLVALGELLALPLAHVATTALIAQNRNGAASIAVCLVPAGRLLAALALIASGALPGVHAIAITHCVGSVVGAGLALGSVVRGLDDGTGPGPRARHLFREGAPYALAALTGGAYYEIDKVVVLQLLGTNVAGVYTAGFRLFSVLLLPINALASNTLPRLFATRHEREDRRLLRWIVVSAVAYAIVAALGALLCAAFVPRVLGADYADSARLFAMFAPWLPLFALHVTGANALVVVGGKNARVAVEALALVAAVLLNLVLMPRIGAAGGALTLLCVEIFLAAACWLLFARRRAAQLH